MADWVHIVKDLVRKGIVAPTPADKLTCCLQVTEYLEEVYPILMNDNHPGGRIILKTLSEKLLEWTERLEHDDNNQDYIDYFQVVYNRIMKDLPITTNHGLQTEA